MADTTGLGYAGGAVIFEIGLAVLAILYFWTDVSQVLLFWMAFILTRPLGATVGDFLDKPVHDGGLAFSRPIASASLRPSSWHASCFCPSAPAGILDRSPPQRRIQRELQNDAILASRSIAMMRRFLF